MTARARAHRSAKREGQRPDARTERWREHRAVVREEFVDAAFRALGKFGPDVSMDDIAEEAGTAATVSSLAESTARLTGMTVDPNLPLHLAFSSDETSQ